MRWDSYSGDYGPNFFGVAVNAATYVINDSEFGWQAFGGNIRNDGNWIKVKPLDALQRRVFVAPLGLWLELDAGTFDNIEIQSQTHGVRIGLAPATAFAPVARLRVEQPAKVGGVGTFHPKETLLNERGAFSIPLQRTIRWVELTSEAR
jgi:hypothetical protein